jgi:uncharacterized protein with GYD domain
MSLFVVKHQHSAETCPAGDPQMGPMLLQHLSKSNASQFGVDIQSEAVVDGQHTLYLVAEADAPQTIEAFMAPFAQAGSVEVLAASPCEQVVARAAC